MATGKSFVRFDESKKVTEAKLDTTKVTASHPVLEVLHDLQDNISFPRSTMKEAVGTVFDNNYKSWNLKEEDKDSWVEVLACRLMNLFADALAKPNAKQKKQEQFQLGSRNCLGMSKVLIRHAMNRQKKTGVCLWVGP